MTTAHLDLRSSQSNGPRSQNREYISSATSIILGILEVQARLSPPPSRRPQGQKMDPAQDTRGFASRGPGAGPKPEGRGPYIRTSVGAITYSPYTWRLQCSTFLVMTCLLVFEYNTVPKKELHRSLQVACHVHPEYGPTIHETLLLAY